ncbi:flagellar basal body L-ring protein FlgH [Ruficoccus amylovorans]|uniref:Flagellar L-ring protein n=1 Tax=Ruficoccus amylovorans TaxID=1804625 RepID=A0A842HET6_9BACT|nr:flagellar basal body L-ring protein FlgH [Ruficoccus amylovorans]MBC2595033.1 flagellar basal body L-ring protein FlgH [Ruficoccus amylovorans]
MKLPDIPTASALVLLCLPVSAIAIDGRTGSLWNARVGARNMFADRIASNIGDIVTVVIEERAAISSKKESNVDKSSSVNDGITRFFYSPAVYPALTMGGELPALGWGANREFSGGGSITDQQRVDSHISVVVIDRLPNGVLVVEGLRRVVLANEINYAVLRGQIRPDDISPDNMVSSSRIADAEVEFVAEGSLTEAQREGWLNRIYDYLSPF